MPDNWKKIFDAITHDAQTIKDTCLNKSDPKFSPWHGKARDAIAHFAPKKLPSFDEITFASDYFLSKHPEDQQEINDRIALLSDIDLFLNMTSAIVSELRKKNRQFIKLADIIPNEPPLTIASDGLKRELGSENLQASRDLVLKLSLSRQDKEDALHELDRVEHELGKTHPDWNLIKRSIKYFLDFDQALACTTIPTIFSLLQRRAATPKE